MLAGWGFLICEGFPSNHRIIVSVKLTRKMFIGGSDEGCFRISTHFILTEDLKHLLSSYGSPSLVIPR